MGWSSPTGWNNDGWSQAAIVAAGATWNNSDKGTLVALSGGFLTASNTGTSGTAIVRSTASHSTGKFFHKLTVNVTGTDTLGVGIADGSAALNSSFLGGNHSLGYYNSDGVDADNVVRYHIGTWTNGSAISQATDIGGKLLWFKVDSGNWNNNPSADPATGTGGLDFSTFLVGGGGAVFAAVDVEGTTDSITADFSGSGAPSGFGAW